MGTVQATAERTIAAATPGQVYDLLADYRDGRPRVLPDAYVDYTVEAGGHGTGTVVTYTLHAAKRQRAYRMEVTEPEPGRVLVETDTTSTFVQRWTVEKAADGGAHVRVSCAWQGAGGIGGFFEGIFAPKGVTRLYDALLDNLERELAAGTPIAGEEPGAEGSADEDRSSG